MHDINHAEPSNVPSFGPEQMVSASELKEFVYCPHAWLLNQQGLRVMDRTVQERQAGIVFHEERAEAAKKASNRQSLWWAILLALLGSAFLLVQALLESRR
ncbi:MAG TPA: hypothetical protein VH477_00915 [Bryobacteraceae bacterium]|jgi:hypothetical protein